MYVHKSSDGYMKHTFMSYKLLQYITLQHGESLWSIQLAVKRNRLYNIKKCYLGIIIYALL